MEFNDTEGFYRPVVDEISCIGCGNCVWVCPASGTSSTSLMGDYMNIYLALTVIKVRHEAMSGGIVNSLIRYIIEI